MLCVSQTYILHLLMAETVTEKDTGSEPHSMGEIAERTNQRILETSDILRSHFKEVLEHEHQLRERMRVTQAIIDEGIKMLDRLRQLLIEKGRLNKAEIEREVGVIRQERDMSLYQEDFQPIRSFYENINTRIDAETAEHPDEMTGHRLRKLELQLLSTMDLGQYVQRHFSHELQELLSHPYDPKKHNELKNAVFNHILENASLTEEENETLRHRVRDLFDFIRLAAGKSTDQMLPASAVYGILGRVPSQDDMNRIFEGDMERLKNLPTGSVRVSFATGSIDFYHEQGQAVPAAINERLKSPIPSRILFVHFRPDSDIRTVLEEMGDDQIMEAERCTDGSCVKVAGVSGTKDIKILKKPDEMTKEDLIAAPMRHLRHDLRFYQEPGT
jgi:hypothetical protein